MHANRFRVIFMTLITAAAAFGADRVKIANGTLEGTGPQASGVREFKGVPFAAPPVGDLRWKEPQPVKNWTGVAPGDAVRAALHAAGAVRRHEFPLQRDERGLPVPERLDAGEIGE